MGTKITNKAIQRHLDALYKEIDGRPYNGSLLYRTRMAYAMAAAFGTKNKVAGIEQEWRQMTVEMKRMKEQVKLEDSTAVKTTLKPVLASWARLTNLRAEMPDSFTISKAPVKYYTDAWERETNHGGGWSRIIVLMEGVMSWWQAYYDKPEEATSTISDKRRGRPTKDFKENILVDEREAVLEQMRSLITGRTNREVALIIRAYISIGYLVKPTFSQVEAEFGKIGNRSGYNKYMNDRYSFSDKELSGAVQAIKK